MSCLVFSCLLASFWHGHQFYDLEENKGDHIRPSATSKLLLFGADDGLGANTEVPYARGFFASS